LLSGNEQRLRQNHTATSTNATGLVRRGRIGGRTKVARPSSNDSYRSGAKHRALEAIDNASKSIKVILGVTGEKYRFLSRNSDFYKGFPDHPRLRSAQHDLRQAHEELMNAKAEVDRKREQTLEDIEVALASIGVLICK
jgi:hypothetical protein